MSTRTLMWVMMAVSLLLGCEARAIYNPEAGRWLSRDPLQEQAGLNLYAYVDNNPNNFMDLLGLYDYSARETWDILMQVRSGAQRGGMSWVWDQYEGNPDPNVNNGDLDFKGSGDTFMVDDKCYKDDAFGNFVAGFAGENAGGDFGLVGAVIGGIKYDVVDPARKSNWNPLSLDADSRPDIVAGFKFAKRVNSTVYNLSQQGYSGFQYSVNTVSITLSHQQILSTMRP